MSATRNQIIEEARSYIGTPYHHQGRIKGVGVDCAGVVVGINTKFELTSHDVKGYKPSPHNGLLQQALADAGFKKKLRTQLQAGDCLLMQFTGEPQHLAVFTGESIIHSYSKIKKVVEHRLSGVWKARVVAVYDFPGVTD